METTDTKELTLLKELSTEIKKKCTKESDYKALVKLCPELVPNILTLKAPVPIAYTARELFKECCQKNGSLVFFLPIKNDYQDTCKIVIYPDELYAIIRKMPDNTYVPDKDNGLTGATASVADIKAAILLTYIKEKEAFASKLTIVS